MSDEELLELELDILKDAVRELLEELSGVQQRAAGRSQGRVMELMDVLEDLVE